MKDFIPCDKCKRLYGPYKQPGYYYSQTGTIIECDCHKNWYRSNIYTIKGVRSNIWNASFDYNPDSNYKGTQSLDVINRLKRYIKLFGDASLGYKVRQMCLYFYGDSGTQKTYISQWIGAEIIKVGRTVMYLKMNALLDMIVKSFDSPEEQKLGISKLLNTDLLIIDNAFEKSSVSLARSGYQLPYLEAFLRERIEDKRKGIIFVSTTNSSDIEKSGYSNTTMNLVMRETNWKNNLFVFKDLWDSFSPNSLF